MINKKYEKNEQLSVVTRDCVVFVITYFVVIFKVSLTKQKKCREFFFNESVGVMTPYFS